MLPSNPISIHAPRVGCDGQNIIGLSLESNFNPRTPCGVRPSVRLDGLQFQAISIHAPRVGCDGMSLESKHIKTFQSTHPVWGATPPWRYSDKGCNDFNPRTPCGVRPVKIAVSVGAFGFQSTHPVWGATDTLRDALPRHRFQSTHPVWGATPAWSCWPVNDSISIHAPRVGCDRPKQHACQPGS